MNPSAILRVLLPTGMLITAMLAGAALRLTLADEHRITAGETAQTYMAKSLDSTLARQLTLEQKFDGMIASLGRIEGALAERNRAEVVVALPVKTKK